MDEEKGVPVRGPVASRDWRDDPGTMTRRQHAYLEDLGATPAQLMSKRTTKRRSLSMNEAIALIEELERAR